MAPEISQILKARILKAMRDHQLEVRDLIAELTAEVPPGADWPRINETFPWVVWGAAFPPFLLTILPPLPDELEYRLVARDLVLVDVHAELVVDILPGALPSPNPLGIFTSGAAFDAHHFGLWPL